MRTSSVATALAAFTAGLATATALRRRADGRLPAVVPAGPAAPAPATGTAAPTPVPTAADAVVLPFVRPAAPAPVRPATPARCGDSGGRTKAGAPCAARATGGGRCHHHRVAA